MVRFVIPGLMPILVNLGNCTCCGPMEGPDWFLLVDGDGFLCLLLLWEDKNAAKIGNSTSAD